jgi:flagellar biosynthesis protein FlgN
MPTLAETLAAEAAAVAVFVQHLKDEQAALEAGNADALPDLVERKSAAVRALAPLSAVRNAALAGDGLPTDRAGIEAWLTKRPNDLAVRQGWQKLQALASEAQELNRVNGELIRLRMQNNAQALEALINAATRQELYSADGQATPGAIRRIIDSA